MFAGLPILTLVLLAIASASNMQLAQAATANGFVNPKNCQSIPCTRGYTPVCATNGKTYGNSCMFVRAQCEDSTLAIASQGACDQPKASLEESAVIDACDKPCTREYKPVCGSDRKTYANACTFSNAACRNGALSIMSIGECEEEQQTADPCDKPCTREYMPLCGSDKRTYANRCVFQNAQCRNGALSILNEGKCQQGSHLRH